MQHLRQVGINEEGVDSILLPAPAVKAGASNKGKIKGDGFLKDVGVIPNEALPSKLELDHTYESQMAIPSDILGFRPDMDRHLRQALEALEDDAFVDDDLEDDFFGELLEDGERAPDEIPKYEFIEDSEPHVENVDATASSRFAPVSDNWEAQFAKFKQEQPKEGLDDSGDEAHSEDMDTVGGLPQLPVIGGKRRRKHTSDASGYSLSSSSMFRNASLSTLDEQFAKVCYQTTCLYLRSLNLGLPARERVWL
jgi:protein LTV1